MTKKRATFGLLALLLFSASLWPCRAGVEDFTFIHASDVHAPMPQSAVTLSRLQNMGEVELTPYGVRVPAPSFVLATGDLTEFGGGNGWFEEYLSYWKNCGIPVHHQLGNHDNTWHALINFLRADGRKTHYSFEAHGCHFVSLMTATPQDPRPSISEEQIVWLGADLRNIGREIPVFVFLHHPLGGSEFASRYDWERLLDVLRGHNTVLLMAGHSHNFIRRVVGGVDQVTGGSTFGPNAGFSVISVKNGIIRGAYWKNAEPAPETGLFEKRIPEKASYPAVQIVSPRLREVCGPSLDIRVELGEEPDGKVTFVVNDDLKGELVAASTGKDWNATGRVSLSILPAGAHYLRVEFIANGTPVSRSTHFFYETPERHAAWRSYLGASSKVSPACADGVVYVGANDGVLSAYHAATGSKLWSSATGAEILGTPLVSNGKVIAGNGAGLVVAHDTSGNKLWSFRAGDAVYSSPVSLAANVVFGCNDGGLYALNAGTGKPVWTNNSAGYAIESAPFAWKEKVFFGAWDQHLRCVDAHTGKLIWERKTEGVNKAKAAHRYYSPGDAAPVVIGDKVLVADRNYMLTIFDAVTGNQTGSMEKVAAVGLSKDKKFAYLRRTDGHLTKIDSEAKELWNVPAGLNAIPVAPTEHKGKVYVCGPTGLLSAFKSDSGELLWQYSVAPKLFVMSSVGCDDDRVYVTSFDGGLTALASD